MNTNSRKTILTWHYAFYHFKWIKLYTNQRSVLKLIFFLNRIPSGFHIIKVIHMQLAFARSSLVTSLLTKQKLYFHQLITFSQYLFPVLSVLCATLKQLYSFSQFTSPVTTQLSIMPRFLLCTKTHLTLLLPYKYLYHCRIDATFESITKQGHTLCSFFYTEHVSVRETFCLNYSSQSHSVLSRLH